METKETICKFNQFGYCKYLTHCRKHHIMDICPNIQCKEAACLFRHPRICKYFLDYGSCKFDSSCAFRHESNTKNKDQEIEALKSELQVIETKIRNLEAQERRLEKLEADIKVIENAGNSEKEQSEAVIYNHSDRAMTDNKLCELEENFYILVKAVDDLEKTCKYLKYNLETLIENS